MTSYEARYTLFHIYMSMLSTSHLSENTMSVKLDNSGIAYNDLMNFLSNLSSNA